MDIPYTEYLYYPHQRRALPLGDSRPGWQGDCEGD